MQINISRSPNNFASLNIKEAFNNIGNCVAVTFDWMLTQKKLFQYTDYNRPNFTHHYNINNARIYFHTITSKLLLTPSLKLLTANQNEDHNSFFQRTIQAMKIDDTIAIKVFCEVTSDDDPKHIHYHMLGIKKLSDTRYELLDGNQNKVLIIECTNQELYQKIQEIWDNQYPAWPFKDYALYELNDEAVKDHNIISITDKYIKKLEEVQSYSIAYKYNGLDVLNFTYALAMYTAIKIALKKGDPNIKFKDLYYASIGKAKPKKGQETIEERINRLLVFSTTFNVVIDNEWVPYKSPSELNKDLKDGEYKNTSLYIRPFCNESSKFQKADTFFKHLEVNAAAVVNNITSKGCETAILEAYKAAYSIDDTLTPLPKHFKIRQADKIMDISILGSIAIPLAFFGTSALCDPEWLFETSINLTGSPIHALTAFSGISLSLVVISNIIKFGVNSSSEWKYYHNNKYTLARISLGVSVGYGAIMAGTCCISLACPDLILVTFNESVIQSIGNLNAAMGVLVVGTVIALAACASISVLSYKN